MTKYDFFHKHKWVYQDENTRYCEICGKYEYKNVTYEAPPDALYVEKKIVWTRKK
jgi:hypothetical protein